jgi:hypothetical protein
MSGKRLIGQKISTRHHSRWGWLRENFTQAREIHA